MLNTCGQSEGGDERRIESLGALDMGLGSWLMVVRHTSSVVTGESRGLVLGLGSRWGA